MQLCTSVQIIIETEPEELRHIEQFVGFYQPLTNKGVIFLIFE
jgi:hypothetical protein